MQMQWLKTLVGFSYSLDLQADLNKLKDVGRSLKAASGKSTIDVDDLLSLIALAAVPASFAPLRAVIENSATTDSTVLKLTNLEARILAEDAAAGAASPSSNSSKALTTQANFKSKSKCQHNRIATCWTCNPELRPSCNSCKTAGLKYYHHDGSRACHQLKKKSNANQAEPQTALLAQALIVSNNDSSSSSWILDSGATDHMSHDINLFNSFTGSTRSVFTASGDPTPCTGTGTIPITYNSSQFRTEKCAPLPRHSAQSCVS